jgi:hypothetical protein
VEGEVVEISSSCAKVLILAQAPERCGRLDECCWLGIEKHGGCIIRRIPRPEVDPLKVEYDLGQEVSAETPDLDQSEVEQLRNENVRLRDVCVDQAEQIATLRATLSGTDRPRAVPPPYRWRAKTPTPDEVIQWQWWWNKPTDGVPHILQLDLDLGSRLLFDVGESTAGACPTPFDPSDWPGEWAPCMTPDDVTAHVSRIAEAARRLVIRHVRKAGELQAQLENACPALGANGPDEVRHDARNTGRR